MKLSPIRTLFAASYAAYRPAMMHLIAFEVLPMLVMMVFGALAFATSLAGVPAAAVAIILIGVIFTIIISICVGIAMIKRVHTPRASLDLRASLEATRPLFLPYLFVGLLVAVFVLIGFILFIIPAIVIGVWLSFSYFVLVLEGVRGMEALKTSKEYVRGLWFPIFGRIIVLVVGMMAFMTVLTVILEIIFGKGGITDLLTTIVNLVISPFALVYFYHLYMDVKRVKHHGSREPETILA